MSMERIYWVDQAKALGLLIVMVVHAPIPHELEWYLRSFSMPRFFIIAGLFLQLHQPWGVYLKAKASRLVIPYFAFSFLTYGAWLALRSGFGLDADIDPWKTVLWIFYGNGGGNMVHNRPLWFLPCLFTTLMLTYFLARIPRPYLYPALALSAIGGYLLMEYPTGLRPLWSLDLILTTAVLTMLGYLFRKQLLDSKPMPWPALLFWLGVSVATAFNNAYVRLSGAEVGNFFLFYLSALAGTIATLDLTKRLPYMPFLSYLGQHTLPVYAMHITFYLFLHEVFKRIPPLLQHSSWTSWIQVTSWEYQVAQVALFIGVGLYVPLLAIKVYDKLKALVLSQTTNALREPVLK